MANNIFNTIIKHTNRDAVKAICDKIKLDYRNKGVFLFIRLIFENNLAQHVLKENLFYFQHI